MNEVFSITRDATISAYNKYRLFYDKKANASPVKKHRLCLLLLPELSNVNTHMSRSLTEWLPLFRIEQVLTNSNYFFRKVGTLFPQCVHRIRLRPIIPQISVEHLLSVNPQDLKPDLIKRQCSERTVLKQALPDLLTDTIFFSSRQTT